MNTQIKPFILRKVSSRKVPKSFKIEYDISSETAKLATPKSVNPILMSGSYMTEARTDPTNDEMTDR